MCLKAEKTKAIKRDAKHLSGIERALQLCSSHAKGSRGFTLVELITIMIIVGILAVAAIPRFFERNTFDSRGFRDQVISTLRYAQKAAIAQHRFVCVTFTPNSIALSQGANNTCGTPLPSLSGQGNYIVTAPTVDVTLSGYADFSFNALGAPSVPQPGITVSGNPAIMVEAETGYVH